MSCTHGSVIVRSSSRMSPVSVAPEVTPSTTTTATESCGSCSTQWIIGGSCERADRTPWARADARPSDLERRLPHGLEAAPVLRARAVARERGQVLLRAVALVLRESVERIPDVQFDEQRVARGLREDRRRRDRGYVAVAADDRPCGAGQL